MDSVSDKIVDLINQWLDLRSWTKIASLVGVLVLMWMMLGGFIGLLSWTFMPRQLQQPPIVYVQPAPNYGYYQGQPDHFGRGEWSPPASGGRFDRQGRGYEAPNYQQNDYDGPAYSGRSGQNFGPANDRFHEVRQPGRGFSLFGFLIGGLFRLACLASLVLVGLFIGRRLWLR